MSSYSSHKKAKIQPELSHKIESKLLITSISKHTNTLPSTILSKYDHHRCEEILQKQYAQKFKTDRKRNSSTKKLSSSKSSFKQFSKSKVMQPSETIQPQRLFFDNDDYREKYNQLYETYLKQKEKWIGDVQKTMGLKQLFCEFLINPDSANAQQLNQLLQNQKISKILRKHIQKNRKWKATESILKEVMHILQVEQNEQILANLSLRVERFRNLDECTFKILQLQSTNKKIMQQFEQKVKKMKKEQQQTTKRQTDRLKEQIQLLKRSKMFLEQQLNLQKQQQDLLLKDLRMLIQSNEDSNVKCYSGRNEVLELHKLIRSLSHRLRDIEVEAQENMFRLLKSNEQMVKFQNLIALIKDDMNKQLTEQQQVNEENICEINHLNKQIIQLQTELEQQKQHSKKLQNMRASIQSQNQDELRLIAAALNLSEPNITKIALKLQEVMRELSSANYKIEQLTQNSKQKDILISELSDDIRKMSESQKDVQQQSKTAQYEKEEYKFLLNNLRDQVIEMKKQHQQQKNRIVRQKDEQIIRSNRDILQSHAILKDQNEQLKSENSKIRFFNEQIKSELEYCKKKEDQERQLLHSKQNEIEKLTEECSRCKKYLKQIQVVFKEVVELNEANTRKIQNYEQDLEQNAKLIKAYQSKLKEAQSVNVQLNQTRNEIKTQLQRCVADVKQLRAERCKIQSTNVQIRLQNINKQTEINRLCEELKNMSKENKNLTVSNQKTLSELNLVTKKLINYKAQLKRKYSQTLKFVFSQLNELKAQRNSLVKMLKQTQKQNSVFVKDMFKQLNVHIQLREAKYFLFNSNQRQQKNMINYFQEQKSLVQTSTHCNLPSQSNQKLLQKIKQAFNQTNLILEQNRQVYEQIEKLKQVAYQQFESMITFLRSNILETAESSQKTVKKVLKRTDTPNFNLNFDQNNEEVESKNNAVIISFQDDQSRSDEVDRINYILQFLIENENEIPIVPFWQKIEANFLSIRRKMNKNSRHLKLDISSIDHRQPVLHSPSSFYFPENQIFKRVNTEPDETHQHPQIKFKESGRSERRSVNASALIEILKRENQQLKIKLVSHIEQNAELEYQNHEMQRQLQEMKIKIQEMGIQIVSLSNQISMQNLQNNFKRLLENLLAQNIDSFEYTCRIIMKLMHFQNSYILDFQQKMSAKKKKKKNGLFAGLFKQN